MNTVVLLKNVSPECKRPRKISAKECFDEMMLDANFGDVSGFMQRENPSLSDLACSEALKALIQWLAAHAVKPATQPIVMLHGPVDLAWHSFIMHTKLYENFCDDYVGYFIHHTPLNEQKADVYKVQGAVRDTVRYLQACFGNDLHPLLVEWVKSAENGDIPISAVSCMGNGYDD